RSGSACAGMTAATLFAVRSGGRSGSSALSGDTAGASGPARNGAILRCKWLLFSFSSVGEDCSESMLMSSLPARAMCDPDIDECSRDEGVSYEFFRPYGEGGDRVYSFQAEGTFGIAGDSKPHTAMFVGDSNGDGDARTLGSEVMT